MNLHDSARCSDAELVRRARAGNRWAKEMLYRRHAPRLLALATRLLANRADAEDAVQDAFIGAFRDLDTLRDPNLLHRWLARITVFQVHRRFRRRKLLRLLRLDGGRHETHGLLHQASPDATPDVLAELALLDRVLDAMPHKLRTPWVLRLVEGYSLEETAHACACSLATAKRRIKRAQREVARHIEIEELSDE